VSHWTRPPHPSLKRDLINEWPRWWSYLRRCLLKWGGVEWQQPACLQRSLYRGYETGRGTDRKQDRSDADLDNWGPLRPGRYTVPWCMPMKPWHNSGCDPTCVGGPWTRCGRARGRTAQCNREHVNDGDTSVLLNKTTQQNTDKQHIISTSVSQQRVPYTNERSYAAQSWQNAHQLAQWSHAVN